MDNRFGVAAIEAAKQRLTRDRGQVERVALRTPAEPSGMPAKFGKKGSRQVRRPRLPTICFEAVPAEDETKSSSERAEIRIVRDPTASAAAE